MALFAPKKKVSVAKSSAVKSEKVVSESSKLKAIHSSASVSIAGVLRRPRITEKAANMTVQNVYTFDIDMRATKGQVMEAVKTLYKVTPRKVNVVNTPATRVRLKKKRGFGKTPASRKAYVFLKKGDEIQLA